MKARAAARGDAIVETASGAWAYLCDKAGLEPSGRDEEVSKLLLARLQEGRSEAPCGFDEALGQVSLKEFVRAFLDVTQPFVQMTREILSFFEYAGATEGVSVWRLGVDGADLELDHFRKWLQQAEEARRMDDVLALSYGQAWQLSQLLEPRDPEWRRKMDSEWAEWFEEYRSGGGFRVPHDVALLGEPFDLIVALLEAALMVMAEHGIKTRASGRAYSAARGFKCVPQDMLDVTTLAFQETDLWFGSVALKLIAIRSEGSASDIAERLTPFVDALPRRQLEVTGVETLRAVLELPIWTKRHELYGVWIATVIMGAFAGHQVRIFHDGGRLAFAFRETKLASVESAEPRRALFGERRVSLVSPVGEGRKGGVQPDYSLWREATSGVSEAELVVECKHYKRPDRASFTAVLSDYARAHPAAQIHLVNYGPVGDPVSAVEEALRWRCSAWGNFHPGSSETVRTLQGQWRAIVGEPTCTEFWAKPGERVILIDVSSSMERLHASEGFRRAVEEVVRQDGLEGVFLANTKVLGRHRASEPASWWEMAPTGGTDLGSLAAALGRRAARLIVVTDGDGANQLTELQRQRRALGVFPDADGYLVEIDPALVGN